MIHESSVIVRYAETDMMGIVHHAVYPIWTEFSRTQLMRDMGISYSEIESQGIMLPVTELGFRYKAPTFFEDKITILSAVTHLDSRRLRLDYQILRNESELCVIGFSKHIFMNAESRRPMRIDKELLTDFTLYLHPEFQQM